MRVVALLALLLAGCALGRVGPDGELVGLAVGPTARIAVCRQGFEDDQRQQSTLSGQDCREIQGSPVSTGLVEFLATAATAVGAWFGLGL